MREARDRLEQPVVSDADIDEARVALRGLSVLDNDHLWAPLEAAAGEVEQVGLTELRIPPVTESELSSGPLSELLKAGNLELTAAGLADLRASPEPNAQFSPRQLAQMLAAATHALGDTQAEQVEQLHSPTQVVRTIRVEVVHKLVHEAEQLAGQPVPPASGQKPRMAWIETAKGSWVGPMM